MTIAYSDTFLVSQHDRACNKFLLEINNPSLLISTSCSCLNDKITTLATNTSKAASGKCPSVSGKCGVSCKSQIIKQRTMEEDRLLHSPGQRAPLQCIDRMLNSPARMQNRTDIMQSDVIRVDRKSQVKQCLDFCSADS